MMKQDRINEYLVSVGSEKEHFLREVLQDQLGRHWLSIYFPEKELKLERIRNPDGEVA